MLIKSLDICAESFCVRDEFSLRLDSRKDIQSVKSAWSVLHTEVKVHVLPPALSAGFVSMKTRRLCVIAYEIFKDINDLNSNFMEVIIYHSPNLTHMKKYLYVHFQNTTKFGN